MSTLEHSELPAGTTVIGRTRGQQYVVQRTLGKGTNGIVYLVSNAQGQQYALKMATVNHNLQPEIKLLFSLHKHWKLTGRNDSNRYLYDVDDYEETGESIPFYVMKYVKGQPLSLYLRARGADRIGIAGLGVLEILSELHESGWVFGDLKAEHVIMSDEGQVDLIDYGGARPQGQSIHQFTEWYDRKYWKAGDRVGDYAYDLFAFAVICLKLFNEPGLQRIISTQLPQIRSEADLVQLIDHTPGLRLYNGWLKKAVKGEFRSTREAYYSWRAITRSGLPGNRSSNDLMTMRLRNAFIWSLIGLGIVLLAIYFRG
ncbi:protein kinase domain-containing protein [Paenibacillus sp. WLX2291]|uniref:protein kinase domain-containing protein n=1 Tax=Paenibacillus sp. WLX2291 TaxID=3296934 RepID=UPI0039844E8A